MFDDGHQIAVACHHGSDEFECPDSAGRISDMGINAYPTLIPDGQPEPTYPYSYASLEAVINDRMAVDAPCTVGVTGSLINNDLTINVTVEKDVAEIPNARVQVVVTEIDIPYTDPNYNNEMNFVNRDMILDNNGSVLTFNGNTAEASVTGTLDPSWNQDNLIIVVWVEDGSTLEVFQATREDIEMFLSDPGAPAIPTDFVTAPDPSGGLSCDISWTNPSLNFSGNTLNELLEMKLYRDGNLIYTDSNPTIGGSGSYTDVPSESGLYNYMVSGYNSFGDGPGAVSSTWVGEDVPNVVEDLVLEDVGGQAYITWTNPTTGLNGGAFNNPITGYNIVRSDGEIFDLLSLETEYTDATVTSGIFYYSVQPYNITGDGGVATSNSVFFGEGSVFNVFIQCDTYGSETTWDIVDDGGTVLFSGGTYAADEIVDVDCILAAGDYIFTIYDSYGDGICCLYGEGYYTLTLDETVLFEGNGEFAYEESTPFTVESGVDADNGLIPVYTTSLGHNYPNPFNPTTNINYNVYGEDVQTELVVYNIKGQKVKQLVSEKLSTGKYTIVWNGVDEQGSKVSSGVYFYKMKAGKFQETKKMILMK